MFIQRPPIPTVHKKELIIILLNLGKMFQIVKTRLTETMNKRIRFCKVIFSKLFSRLIIDLKTTFA